ncbi:Qat anti-phage system QueC-like protein QatC [Cupriavidus sp. 2MCAB6]|uniref:Qat anti-phage system QueC-like protein QatC n=1 Tax=Cupriavidus sp. 2MCAB6 TaxID=3232981 RepID=UPI003F8DF5DD
MNRVICVPPELIPQYLSPGVDYISMYRSAGRQGVSSVGTSIQRKVQRSGILPDVRTWDFSTFALAVSAADLAVARATSADGWTRVIDLTVALVDPEPFRQIVRKLQVMLRFLTGDFWHLTFIEGADAPPFSLAPKVFEADCVSLLSGGVDSLVGAIDATNMGWKPLFVSQIAKGDARTQRRYALRLGARERYLQWNHNIKLVHPTERSTRGRSIVFFAFAAIAASAISGVDRVNVFVPENGFISLNIPLNPGRAGSLSTKTTHPVFMERLQEVWTELGLRGRLMRPYSFKTKGEIICECRDVDLLMELVGDSTSCGRYGYYKYTHCGRCVPCLVRRSSFLRAGVEDPTERYHFPTLRLAGRENGANDIGAVAAAVLRYREHGVRRLTSGQLAFANSADRAEYEGVVARGIEELGQLLEHAEVF